MFSLLGFVSNFSYAGDHKLCDIPVEIIENNDQLPKAALSQLAKSVKGRDCLENKFILVDYTKSAKEDRLYYFAVENEKIKLLLKTKVSHGRNSGTLYPTEFSNDVRTKKTSLGLYSILPSEKRSHDLNSYPLIGLEKTNANASVRGITIHSADYVSESWAGRSSGCFALSKKDLKFIHENNAAGAYLYAYYQN